ncbi:MAG: hypothetical protein JO083_10955 [Candidatus Eremiobacteraeota bacterium]|nr:hypothetical protein [Candidatus Eremiobacteraeota bacterium]
MNAEDRPVEERRKGEDRRKLYGKPFLAMLAGALPEDRRKGERRKSSTQNAPQRPESIPTVRGEDTPPR